MDKTVEYFLNLPYTIELRPDAEAGWFVRVKEWLGCMSQGDTPDEALANIREVIPLWLETSLANGAAIPEPHADEEYSGKFVVRVPRSLHRELAERAEAEGVSLNHYVSVALSKTVGSSAGPAAVVYSARPTRARLRAGVRERRPKGND